METITERNAGYYLAQVGLTRFGQEAQTRPLTGGVSSRAYWVDLPEGAFVIKQARQRLDVAMEWVADVGRTVREGEAMDLLHRRIGSPAIPELLHLDRANLVLVMEAILPPAENYKDLLMRGVVNPDLACRFGILLAEIHNATKDDATRDRFGDTRLFEQLRLSPYYDTTAERHAGLARRIASLRDDCLRNTACLVHGDYSPKNVLVKDGQLILLDYEAAHFGNPAFDVGFALTHYLCKAIHLPGHAPSLIDAARRFWRGYEEEITLPDHTRSHAGAHLATVMLARIDGKSPLEYLTEESERAAVREIAVDALQSESPPDVPAVIAAVERKSA